MSTTYAVPDEKHKGDFWVIGRTSDFTLDAQILLPYLANDTPIIAIDNDTDIKTLQELKEYYKTFQHATKKGVNNVINR